MVSPLKCLVNTNDMEIPQIQWFIPMDVMNMFPL